MHLGDNLAHPDRLTFRDPLKLPVSEQLEYLAPPALGNKVQRVPCLVKGLYLEETGHLDPMQMPVNLTKLNSVMLEVRPEHPILTTHGSVF